MALRHPQQCPGELTTLSDPVDQTQTLHGDPPAAAEPEALPDRNELATVAMERTRMPMVVTDPRQPDNPIVLANKAFLDLTGYSAEEVIGRNCRFLQGEGTSPEAVEQIRQALREERDLEVEILNYRKDGSALLEPAQPEPGSRRRWQAPLCLRLADRRHGLPQNPDSRSV